MSVDITSPAADTPVLRSGPRSSTRLVWDQFRTRRSAMLALVFLVVLAVVAIAAPLVADLVGHGPNDLYRTTMLDPYGLPRGPSAGFLFGADSAGRDLFVRVIYGARVSLLVGLIATLGATVIGVVLGLVAGYRGGIVDTLLSRLSDVVLAMPLLLFAIGI
jgi:peptide/nickel transport system permease protein